jgi:hypothetical protein
MFHPWKISPIVLWDGRKSKLKLASWWKWMPQQLVCKPIGLGSGGLI